MTHPSRQASAVLEEGKHGAAYIERMLDARLWTSLVPVMVALLVVALLVCVICWWWRWCSWW
jgi:hypothetical protein